MCGIAGELQFEAAVGAEHTARIQSRTTVSAMCAVLSHRGPDDSGLMSSGPLTMGMRRLSIIDLAGGKQPIANEDRSIWVVCNGEIYNYREIRAELVARGHQFRSGSDVEVLVHLYEDHGLEFVRRLRGMFAFALWITGPNAWCWGVIGSASSHSSSPSMTTASCSPPRSRR